MNNLRVRSLNDCTIASGPIVYWMIREHRVYDNWALIYAQKLAQQRGVELMVVFSIRKHLKEYSGTARMLDFMFAGLKQVYSTLDSLQIPFHLLLSSSTPDQEVTDFVKKYRCGALITDASPLLEQIQWKKSVANKIDISMFEVDARNVIPVWETSEKQEYAAYTLRPKIQKKLESFVDEFPTVNKQTTPQRFQTKVDWAELRSKIEVDESIRLPIDVRSGYTFALRKLADFLDHSIQQYDQWRNDPNADATSGLSAYLHFGQLSAQRVLLEINKRKIQPKLVESFVEELVVRRELAENFCFYNSGYKTVQCFPRWAQDTLRKHKADRREHEYSYKEFQHAQTHDPLWNAAQMQMVNAGYMHGYLRMYWAKKMLEWTSSVQDAMNFAISLNDTYQLDGRDPNGYVGIAWSIGGVHDRPWFERPIFGSVRYMNYSGAQKKFDVSRYVSAWLNK